MRNTIITLLLTICCLNINAQTAVRFGNEAADTARITELLQIGTALRNGTQEDRVAFFGKQFIGTPYGAHTLERTPEMLTVRLDSIDCTTFVELCMALANTSGEGRTSWRDFVYNLENIRYRGGEVNGYPSRLHYICDWALDNQHRGNFRDVTRDFPSFREVERTIDFMSANRDRYPALKDSANYERIRRIENGYRLHRFPYIKTSQLRDRNIQAAFRSGDVVGLVSNLKNLDVTHMGIVVRQQDGTLHLLHASSSNGKVEISQQPLHEFMKKNIQFIGLRVFRLKTLY